MVGVATAAVAAVIATKTVGCNPNVTAVLEVFAMVFPIAFFIVGVTTITRHVLDYINKKEN